MIPGENFSKNTRFEPFKLLQNGMKSNMSSKSNMTSHSDELMKMQLLKKKEKYAIDCPLCTAHSLSG